jgi:hypothetical protein
MLRVRHSEVLISVRSSSTMSFSSVTALEKLHAKHALPGFTDRSAEEKEIEAATTDITKVYDSLSHYTHFICSSPYPLIVPSLLFRNRIFGNARN